MLHSIGLSIVAAATKHSNPSGPSFDKSLDPLMNILQLLINRWELNWRGRLGFLSLCLLELTGPNEVDKIRMD